MPPCHWVTIPTSHPLSLSPLQIWLVAIKQESLSPISFPMLWQPTLLLSVPVSLNWLIDLILVDHLPADGFIVTQHMAFRSIHAITCTAIFFSLFKAERYFLLFIYHVSNLHSPASAHVVSSTSFVGWEQLCCERGCTVIPLTSQFCFFWINIQNGIEGTNSSCIFNLWRFYPCSSCTILQSLRDSTFFFFLIISSILLICCLLFLM